MTQTKLIQTFVVCLGIWASHVYGDTQCTNLGGTCQTDTNACSGPYVSGLCSGPASRRCCVPGDSACEVIFGTCKTDTLSCSGIYSSVSAREAAQNLISCGVQSGKISSSYTLSGHRDVGTTACPGTSLYNEIQTWDNYSST
uniref:Peptidoglycan recognition protein 2 n=1 Tax=Solen grandis TaxID=165599 RepID=G9IBU8_9BIVA|nr:peptidoglycan recognition protein 2 [Solen grandis]